MEFALVMPLVLTLSLALLQVGLFVKDQLVVVGAARAGAREAAVTTDEAQVARAVEEAASSLDVADLDSTVAREGGAGSAVTVRVVYRSAVTIPIVRWLFSDTVELEATATMRQETE